jgi:hypothetical protein
MTNLEDYKDEKELELKEQRYTLTQRLKHLNHEKYPTAKFHQLCNLTFNSLGYKIPLDFPRKLKVATTPQQAVMYSNIAKAALLYSLNYNHKLKTNRATLPYTIFKPTDLDFTTVLEQRIELFTYLNELTKTRGKK